MRARDAKTILVAGVEFSDSILDRFWSKVLILTYDRGCWIWTGSTQRGGYGEIGRGWRELGNIKATHLSWLIHFGPIPDGMDVLHKCDYPPCIRPDHLFAGTASDNARDAIAKGRWDPKGCQKLCIAARKARGGRWENGR